MNEYVIINKTLIQKRIEDLEKVDNLKDREEAFKLGRLKELNIFLTKSTPLIPEIENAFDVGVISRRNNIGRPDLKSVEQDKQNYISNFKLAI